jgi:uncharacterized membrane protein YkoI
MKRMFAIVIIMGVLVLAMPVLAQEGVSIAQAEQIITQTYPNQPIISIQRTQQNNVLVWEARLNDGTIIYVDAQSGEITGRVQAPSVQAAVPAQASVPAQSVAARGLPAIDFEQALSIALSQYPNTALIKAELEPAERTGGMGDLMWDMKMSNGMAVYVDATSGTVVELEPWGGRRGPNGTPVGTPAIDLSQALSIAQGYFPQGTFTEIKLEQSGRREGYVIVWKVEFGRGAEVIIDANSGDVLRVR